MFPPARATSATRGPAHHHALALARGRARWRRALAARRRLLAAALLAAAVAVGLQQLSAGPPAQVAVAVAAGDLPAGHVVTHSDITVIDWLAGTSPNGVVADPVGAVLASPVRRGEPITDARLHGPGLLAGQPPGIGAMAITITDPAPAAMRPGDRVDVLAGPVQGVQIPTGIAQSDVIAESAMVLAAASAASAGAGPASLMGSTGSGATGGEWPGGADGGGSAPRVLVLAVDTRTARALSAASGLRSLSVVLHGNE